MQLQVLFLIFQMCVEGCCSFHWKWLSELNALSVSRVANYYIIIVHNSLGGTFKNQILC